jgi:hypothetical protein
MEAVLRDAMRCYARAGIDDRLCGILLINLPFSSIQSARTRMGLRIGSGQVGYALLNLDRKLGRLMGWVNIIDSYRHDLDSDRPLMCLRMDC